MRKLILTATGLVCLTGISYFIATAGAQGKGAASEEGPHKIGLIDMGYVFNEYDKLKVMREDYKAEFQDSEAKAKTYVEKAQKLQEEMKTFGEGSPEYTQRETALAKVTSDFDTFRKVTQKDLLRKEAKMYHTIYMEVQDAVNRFCKTYNYTLVLRYSREELNSTDPQKLIAGLNRQVVYHRPADDLTDSVLQFLNQRYEKSAGAGAGAVAPVGGTGKKAGKPAATRNN